MKFRKPLLAAVIASALLSSADTFAQDAPPPPPPPSEMMQPAPPPPAQPMPASDPGMAAPAAPPMPQQTGSAQMQTASGDLTVHSSMPPAAPAGPAPSFEQLSGGAKSISEDQAAAYPLLANDFDYADRNSDGHISRSEYKRWTTQQ